MNITEIKSMIKSARGITEILTTSNPNIIVIIKINIPCNKEVDGGWTVLNTCLSLRTELMIGFGLSPGTLVEIAYSKYHKKYLGKVIPVLLDERTVSGRLNLEIEDEIDLRYFNSSDGLNQLLEKLRGSKFK